MAVFGGLGTVSGPLLGAIILTLAPEVFRFVSDYRMLVYGGLLVLMMRFQPQGLVGDDSGCAGAGMPFGPGAKGARVMAEAKKLLQVRGLKKHFGGLKAVDGVDLSVQRGETLGLIGPNGAGKTTFFNMVCGYYTPTEGSILLGGQEIQGLPAHAVARKGIARTFQITKCLRI